MDCSGALGEYGEIAIPMKTSVTYALTAEHKRKNIKNQTKDSCVTKSELLAGKRLLIEDSDFFKSESSIRLYVFLEIILTEQPFSKEKIKVTDTKAFLDSILPYMIRQRIIMEEEDGGKVWYRLRK